MTAAAPAPETGTYAHAVVALDARIARAERLALAHPDDWGRFAEVGGLWAERARLTGDYADYGRAEDAYRGAFALAPEGSGPILARAKLDYTLHRLDRVDPALDLLEGRRLDDNERAEVTRIRADLALQRGHTDEAAAGYQRSLALHPTLAAQFGLAQVAWWTGDHNGALAGIDAAEALVRGDQPTTRMWLDLQRGLVELSRGRTVDALGHYRDADAHVSGHWLVREHIAEASVLLGDLDGARKAYEDIVIDTHNPEFVDAYAELLVASGRPAEAVGWTALATAAYERQLDAFPEAAAGHALDHFLTFGTDPDRTVALAEQNAATRPNGEALTKLATALRQAGRHRDAAAALARAAATGWVSAERDEEAAKLALAVR